MKCFYHSADLDGHCSGAIVKYFYPECEMFPINYGQDFPWEKIQKNDWVYMVDFSLQPFDEMIKLNNLCNLVWIDHHATAIEDCRKSGVGFKGITGVGLGACALTWEYFALRVLFPDKHIELPWAVKLLAEYDVWNHEDNWTLPFQYGLRLKSTWPDEKLIWYDLFTGGVDACRPYVEAGRTILEYEVQTNAKFCKAYAFETEFNWGHKECPNEYPTHSFKAICVNKGFTNSKVFDSVWDASKYDLMVTFCRLPLPKHQWTVSIYSDKADIDCGDIAKAFGGGGHKGAAGFQCKELPFDF